jgi:hypothetical protein
MRENSVCLVFGRVCYIVSVAVRSGCDGIECQVSSMGEICPRELMREIGIFVIVFVLLVTVLAGVIRLLGGSFGLDFGESWYLGYVALAILAPGVLNIHGFASADSQETTAQRLLALIRGLGSLVAAAACIIPIFTTIKDSSVVALGVGIGLVMNVGTLPLEYLCDRKR